MSLEELGPGEGRTLLSFGRWQNLSPAPAKGAVPAPKPHDPARSEA